VVTASAIGGISAIDLSVVSAVVSGVTTDTFQYNATATASGISTGSLDLVICSTWQRKYIVGSDELKIYLNGVLQTKGQDYNEVGTVRSVSSTITLLKNLVLNDTVTYVISANTGLMILNQNGASTLQSAYNNGSTITTTTGVPVVITGTSAKLLHVTGDIQVDGIVDPTAISLTPQSSNPLPLTTSGIWIDNSGNLMHQYGDTSQPVNISTAIYNASNIIDSSTDAQNGESYIILQGNPVYINTSGQIQVPNVSSESQSLAIIGLVQSNVAVSGSGKIITSGLLTNVTGSFSVGDALFVSKTGVLTNVKPSIGVGGFVAFDWVVKVGVVVKNQTNPSLKDIVVNVQVMGQL
jgi:hypothetical protein